MSHLETQVSALRQSAAWSEVSHIHPVRITGEEAFEALDALCPAELYLQDTQILTTLLLDDDGHPLSDLLVCRDDRDFLLLSEGLDAPSIGNQLEGGADALDVSVEDLGDGHTLFSVDGPYAWEVVAELVGPDVIGLPYLSFLSDGRIRCFRSGKTGEFGYLLLVPEEDSEETREKLAALSARYDMAQATLGAIDLCALENWFFNIRKEGRFEVTPLELQLQWRVSYRKKYRGSSVVEDRRRNGPSRRLTTLFSDRTIEVGDPVLLKDEVVGEFVNTGYSFIWDEYIGLALMDVEYAVPGIEIFEVRGEGDGGMARSVSPPVLNNRSLYVSPQLHSYATRGEETFPPIAAKHAW